MQVPEKLSLIGGSILLASTLVFTLKSQASDILPKVDSGMSSLVNADNSSQSSNGSSQSQQPSQQDQQEQQRAQADQAFNNNFQQAQQKGWQTGTWGSAKFYIDNNEALHVGSGNLQNQLYNVIGADNMHSIKTVSFDLPVKAPQNSFSLIAGNSDINGTQIGGTSSITSINNLSNLDTSDTTNMVGMFANNNSLTNLDVSNLKTNKVTDMGVIFAKDYSLPNINVSHWDVSNVTNLGAAFAFDGSFTNLDLNGWNTKSLKDLDYAFQGNAGLTNLNISNFDTSNATNMSYIFDSDQSLSKITQGNETKNTPLAGTGLVHGNWKNNNQVLDSSAFQDNNSHPGTWIRQ